MSSWAEAVLEREPRVAVFDCDGTLWGGDGGSGFMHWSLEQGLLHGSAADRLRQRYSLYLEGKVDELTICGEMVQVYAGLREDQVRAAAEFFFQQVMEPLIFPEMQALVEKLHSAGAELWAVSSTCDWVIEAGLRGRFPIPPSRTLAARVRVEQGTITDRLLAVPTDALKATTLAEASVAQPDAVFGNSIHDLQMLQIGRHAYPVNPTAALLNEAGQAGWPIFWPTGTGVAAKVDSLLQT